MIAGEKHKIYLSRKSYDSELLAPGSIFTDGKKFLKIACEDGFVEILEIQADKRKKMDIKSFLNGTLLDVKHVDK